MSSVSTFSVRAVANSSLPSYVATTPKTGSIAIAGGHTFVSGNVTYVLTATANGALSLDGITMNVGDAVVVTQSAVVNGIDAGFYKVAQDGSATTPWIMVSYFQNQQNGQLAAGTLFTVDATGSTQHNSIWSLTTGAPITLGTTVCTFAQRLAPA